MPAGLSTFLLTALYYSLVEALWPNLWERCKCLSRRRAYNYLLLEIWRPYRHEALLAKVPKCLSSEPPRESYMLQFVNKMTEKTFSCGRDPSWST